MVDENSLAVSLGRVRGLVADAELELALEAIMVLVSDVSDDLRNEVMIQKARLARLRKNFRAGLISYDASLAEENAIAHAVLELADDVPLCIERRRVPFSGEDVDFEAPADNSLEKIIGSNELKEVAWLARGLEMSRAVCRITTPNGVGSGFLVSGGYVMTNNHVVASAAVARSAVAEFNYEYNENGVLRSVSRYSVDSGGFWTSESLDCSRIKLLGGGGLPDLAEWGSLIFEPSSPAPSVGEHVSIIQHPGGGPKQIALTANQVVNVFGNFLQYTTDTLPGSSGSPVFDSAWRVVAIHHAGGNVVINSKGEKMFANEGVLASAVRAAMPA